MAYFGVCKQFIAKVDNDSYTGGTVLPLAGVSVTPVYASGDSYLDNKLGLHRKEMTKANVTSEVGTIPLAVAAMMYGHTLSKDGKALTYKTTDKAPYCGFGFIGQEAIDNDTDRYTACWIYKVMFEEGEDAFTTHGENITFTNQKFSGVAVGKKDNTWKDIEQFDTEEEAETWLKAKANITELQATA